jgi:hypothetical protein
MSRIFYYLAGDINVGKVTGEEDGVMVNFLERLRTAPPGHIYKPQPHPDSLLNVRLTCRLLHLLARNTQITLNVFHYDCGAIVRMADIIRLAQQKPLHTSLVSTIRLYSPSGWYDNNQDDWRPLTAMRNLERVEVAWPGNRRQLTRAKRFKLANQDTKIRTTIIQALQRDVNVVVIRGGAVALHPNNTQPSMQSSWLSSSETPSPSYQSTSQEFIPVSKIPDSPVLAVHTTVAKYNKTVSRRPED